MKTILLHVFLLFTLFSLSAHPGRTDSNGGHYNRKTGEYHYHGAPKSSSASKPNVAPYTSGNSGSMTLEKGSASGSIYTEAEIDRRIGLYFQAGNQGLINKPITKVYERDVSQSLKDRVKARDGHKCFICGSTVKLEVDHIIALMNGGTNDIGNLATLCDSCHTKKTRMDGSLRRKREQLYGKAPK